VAVVVAMAVAWWVRVVVLCWLPTRRVVVLLRCVAVLRRVVVLLRHPVRRWVVCTGGGT
jgi:hypothetical protein